MIKISYHADPFYADSCLNEPCTKDLIVEFAEDASMTEIIAEFIKVLYYAGYPRLSNCSFEGLGGIIETLYLEGVIDINEEVEE